MVYSKTEIVEKTEQFVREVLSNAEGGHDWFHILRVRNLAMRIGRTEDVDLYTVELGALLHDIADYKFHDGDVDLGPKKAVDFLNRLDCDTDVVEHVEQIIRNISYRGGRETTFQSRELDVLRDADRLDAIGAIGIARTFNYGGFKNRPLYDPSIPPVEEHTESSYTNSTAPTLNHFYEKLLRLKDTLQTEEGRRIAEDRHAYMQEYVERFLAEWRGEA
jgi:uncharacterized protein